MYFYETYTSSNNEPCHVKCNQMICCKNLWQYISVKLSVTYHQKSNECFLSDPNGTKVHTIEHKHRGDAVQINAEILREWATEKGKASVCW